MFIMDLFLDENDLLNGLVLLPGGNLDFKWQVWSNGGKNQNPKKSLGFQAKPQEIPGPKYNPKKIPCQISKP